MPSAIEAVPPAGILGVLIPPGKWADVAKAGEDTSNVEHGASRVLDFPNKHPTMVSAVVVALCTPPAVETGSLSPQTGEHLLSVAFFVLAIHSGQVTKMSLKKNLNHSAAAQVTEFIILGITENPHLQLPLFAIFLIIYLVTVMGNLGMVTLTHLDSKLHNPMYFFLRHLSITDLGYSTAIGPKMMVNFVAHKNPISYSGCATQLASFEIFIITELFILSAMAYDRYVAICRPLTYMIVMVDKVCWALVVTPYLYSTFVSLLLTVKLFTLSFCGSNIIRYFYCDCLPLIAMLCSDTRELELIVLIFSGCNLLSSFLIVLISYVFILVAIVRMNSTKGRYKAFTTCSSHLTVVVVFYGTLLFIYLQPKSSHTLSVDKMASVFYTLVIPMLNPLIYSLRNKEVKDALKRTLNRGFRITIYGVAVAMGSTSSSVFTYAMKPLTHNTSYFYIVYETSNIQISPNNLENEIAHSTRLRLRRLLVQTGCDSCSLYCCEWDTHKCIDGLSHREAKAQQDGRLRGRRKRSRVACLGPLAVRTIIA
ncbi:olfactory receptor 8K1 [Octodon degus]|uniref:Olfactory receptor 8K1 n=1 Tax=Octodon degus TaxID=10160 RepID=A0A6P3FS75_OCTDE|nr:olfactory receptor 8K1 [Octodon degus]